MPAGIGRKTVLDPVKKVRKAVAADLHPGEEIVAATLVQPAGEMSRQIGRGVGGIAGGLVTGKSAKKRVAALAGADEAGIAASLPSGQPLWLAVTPQRVLVWSHSQLKGKPKELQAELRRDQIAAVEVEKKKTVYAMVVRFDDNSALDFDVPKVGGDAPGFAKAFEAS